MKRLLLLCLVLSSCSSYCAGACFSTVEKAAGSGADFRREFRSDSWLVKKSNGEVWRYYTQGFNSCEVTGKELIFR